MENLFAMKNMKEKFPPVFPSLFFYFPCMKRQWFEELRFWQNFGKSCKLIKPWKESKVPAAPFSTQISESSNNENEEK
jgi:hypothetical protein